MLNLGMPLEDVSKMLGHKSIRTTQRYARVRKERIQQNFNKFVRPQIGLSVEMIQQPTDQKVKNVLNSNFNNGFSTTQLCDINYSYSYTTSA